MCTHTDNWLTLLSADLSSIWCWTGRAFDELWVGAVTSAEMRLLEVASPEVTGNDVTGSCITGNDFIGSDVTGSVMEIIFCAFFLTGFFASFFFEITSESTRKFGSFPWDIPFSPAELSTNENLGNSTNEMPQSLFQLAANHGSPYRFNESVRTIYNWPFVESLYFV